MDARNLEVQSVLTGHPLPDDISFYTVDDQFVFNIRKEDGSMDDSVIAYLVTTDKGKHYRYGMEFNSSYSIDAILSKLQSSIDEFQKQLNNENGKTFNPDNGDLKREKDN